MFLILRYDKITNQLFRYTSRAYSPIALATAAAPWMFSVCA